MIKHYAQSRSRVVTRRRTLTGTERFNINGINDLTTICTSHVERNNLTIRTFMQRFTRFALGFSKKVENLAAATAIHVAVYNFLPHSRHRCHARNGCRVIDRLWSMDDLFYAGDGARRERSEPRPNVSAGFSD